MLLELQTTIQRLLYDQGQVSPREVEITFEAPTQERIDKLTRPTINVFLCGLQENAELRQNNFQPVRNDGRAGRRLPPRRFDLRYMVSALTTNVEDEHLLLWRVLTTLVRYPQLPEELLPEEVRALEMPLVTRCCQAEESQNLASIWNALGVPPHPALSYVITVPVDMNLIIEAPLVLTRTARYTRTPAADAATEISHQIGGLVRNEKGEPLAGVRVELEGRVGGGSVTNSEGRFTLSVPSSGKVRLYVSGGKGMYKSVEVEVLDADAVTTAGRSSYDIVLETTDAAER